MSSDRGERCEHCGASTWCRFTGPASEMPCDADPRTGARPGTYAATPPIGVPPHPGAALIHVNHLRADPLEPPDDEDGHP